MRSRKRGFDTDGYITAVDGLIPPTTTTTNSVPAVRTDKEWIIDVKHPEWFVSKGKRIIVGPLSRVKTRRETSTGTAVFEPQVSGINTWSGRSYDGNICHLCSSDSSFEPSWFVNDIPSRKQHAVNNAYAKAYSSTATVLVTAAEMHKTIGMVKRPFEAARTLLLQMTRRYRNLLSKGLSAARAASAAWLEYRMGWKPVLYDLENIGKAVRAYMTTVDFKHYSTYRSGGQTEWSGAKETTESVTLRPAVVKVGTIQRVHYTIGAGVILSEWLYDEQSRPWQQIFGMQLHDVAPAVWELMPYSFVIDRFVEVQTWLTAIQPRPGTKVEGSWVTTVMNSETSRRTLDMSMTINLPGKTVVLHQYPGDSSQTSILQIERQVDVSPSILPTLNPSALKLNQHLDHAALVIGQLVGLFPEVKNRDFWKKKS